MDFKEWVRVSHSANGVTTVTVTLVDENLTARWSVKTYSGQLEKGLDQARTQARLALDELRKALG